MWRLGLSATLLARMMLPATLVSSLMALLLAALPVIVSAMSVLVSALSVVGLLLLLMAPGLGRPVAFVAPALGAVLAPVMCEGWSVLWALQTPLGVRVCRLPF